LNTLVESRMQIKLSSQQENYIRVKMLDGWLHGNIYDLFRFIILCINVLRVYIYIYVLMGLKFLLKNQKYLDIIKQEEFLLKIWRSER